MIDDAAVIAHTQAWLRHAVIGLNLCPFARGVVASGRVRCVVSHARASSRLLAQLSTEMRLLAAADAQALDTTLLIHPGVLKRFPAYNDFLDQADALLRKLRLRGVLQVASFHPHYRFAGSAADDPANASNRAPYPTLHLLREASIERALKTWPQPESIYERNITRLRELGPEGWARLSKRWSAGAPQ